MSLRKIGGSRKKTPNFRKGTGTHFLKCTGIFGDGDSWCYWGSVIGISIIPRNSPFHFMFLRGGGAWCSWCAFAHPILGALVFTLTLIRGPIGGLWGRDYWGTCQGACQRACQRARQGACRGRACRRACQGGLSLISAIGMIYFVFIDVLYTTNLYICSASDDNCDEISNDLGYQA
jgi:hypothetical protein